MKIHRPSAIVAFLLVGLLALVASYVNGRFTMHGSGPNFLGWVLFVMAYPAAVVSRWFENIAGAHPEWLFWLLFLGPYLIPAYFISRRFFRWLEPEDILRKLPEDKP